MVIKLKLLNLKEENFKSGIFGTLTNPPLCHAFLAAMIPKDLDIDVEIIDEQIEKIDFGMDCDVVAFSLSTHIARKGYEYAKRFRKRGKTVVMGGYHVTLMPDEAQAHADSIVVGEAEKSWVLMLRDLAQGTLKPRYVSQGPVDLKDTPLPRRDLLKVDKYFLPSIVVATRGCPYMCTYCASSKIFGRHRRRDADAVIREIKDMRMKNWKERLLVFGDDELFYPKKDAIEFFRKLEKLDVRWISQTTLTTLFDRDLLKAAALSGCVGLTVGVESLNPDSHVEMNKKQNLKRGIDDAVLHANNLGIGVGALMMLGLDTDCPESVEKTLSVLERSRFNIVTFSILRAYPTTSIYDGLKSQGRIIEDWWLTKKQYGDAVSDVPGYLCVQYKPRFWTPLELQEKAVLAELRLNSLLSYHKWRNIFTLFRKGDKSFVLRMIVATVLMNMGSRRVLKVIRKAKRG